MQRAFRNGRALAALLFWLFCWSLVVTAQSEDNSNETSGTDTSTSTISDNSSLISTIISSIHDTRNNEIRQTTCRTGTVNYITHSLPQQCLTRPLPISNSTITTSSTTPSVSSSLVHQEPKTTPIETPTSSATQPENEFETDSPLDNANFLSFEEWKKQNLAKVGQSPDHVGQKSRQDKPTRDIRPIDNALDILGEDSEIELDFGGFGRQDSSSSSRASAQPTVASEPTLRSRDAGKTCKERSNYASFDCAATALKSNPESKSAHAVLIENKDSYMLNICSSSNKFLIVELCNDILIDTIVLANYEFFSSIFRNFRVSVSDRYPVKPDRWKELGVFEARNTRSVQAFLVEQPLIWARYLRIEFLTHYGNEYYCPVSLLRVHGTTMMEEFRHQEDLTRGEISDDLEESVMPDASASSAQDPPQEPLQSSKEADRSIVEESATAVETPSDASAVPQSPDSDLTSVETPATSASTNSNSHPLNASSEYTSTEINISSDNIAQDAQTQSLNTTSSEVLHTPQTTANSSMQTDGSKNTTSTLLPTASSSSLNSTGVVKSPERIVTPPAHTSSVTSFSTQQSSQQAPAEPINKSASTNSTMQASTNSSSSIKSTNSIHKPSSAASDIQQKPGTSTVSSAQSNPTTQESFFKSIHKRLQMLESNATLSLQYIEEQSRILRDAFIKVEKRQIKKTEAFLENLNATVFAELQDFKQQYDQLWQSTVIELDNHRDQYQREILAVSARLSIVADELVFQKRMAIAQMTVLMICLSLVLFVRAGGGASLDIPIIQQMVNKSQLSRSSYYSPLNSPSPDQSSPPFTNEDIRRRRGFWRSNIHSPASPRPISRGNGNISEASIEENPQNENPDLRFQPPTPTLGQSNGTDGEDVVMVSPSTSFTREEGSFADEGMDSEDDLDDSSASLPQTQSSPSTPSGSRDLKIQPWPAGGDGSGIANDDPKVP